MIKKVWTYGCSVSNCSYSPGQDVIDACLHPERTYSGYLSDLLQAENMHYAKGCGSNDRIFRLVCNHIINGQIKSDDLIIIQYTNVHRREFWSRHEIDLNKWRMREQYKDGQLLRFMPKWPDGNPIEKNFQEIYADNFLGIDYDIDVFEGRNMSLQALCELYKIPTIFITSKSTDFDFLQKTKYIDKVDIKEFFLIDQYLPLFNDDDGHFTPAGHKAVAKKIYKKLLDLNLV